MAILKDWYLLSLAALVLMGLQRFLYKVAAERGCNIALTTAVFMATVTLISTGFYVIEGAAVNNPGALLLLALVNGLAFVLATISNMEALKRVPAPVAYPLVRLNILLVVIFAVVYFGDRLTPLRMAGMATALAALLVLARERGKSNLDGEFRPGGFLHISIAILAGAAAAISGKFAALHVSKSAFMALSYLVGTIYALVSWRHAPSSGRSDAVLIGLVMGLLNFAGFYVFLSALEIGPLSVIALIAGMHFVVAVICSALFFRDRMTRGRLAGAALTVLSLILLAR